MKSILKQLYEGDMSPIEQSYPLMREYKEQLDKAFLRARIFSEELNKEKRMEFEELFNEYYDLIPYQFANEFYKGFALGIKLMAEIYNME